LHGIVFPNPVGLAAGFDKDAKLIYGVAASGFGYEEAGSVSAQPSDGNAKPRLWWMKKTKATLVYSGLHNDGAAAIAKRLHGKRFFVPLGISIAKTNSPDTVTTEAGIQDYVATMRTFRNIGDYFAVNISCPNAYGGQPFHSRETLSELLKQLDTIQTDKPIFIKVSPDLSNEEFDGVIDVALEYGVQGLICGNSTKKHNPDAVREEFPSENGGMGGVPVADISDRQVAYAYKKCKDQLTIIGCGGIFTAEDAYRKIKLGASLVQVATGVFFEGPTLSSSINEGLIRLLKRDGYASITEAIGVDNHT
jgi:dihydroorotate dehydrogenase subfamily 2